MEQPVHGTALDPNCITRQHPATAPTPGVRRNSSAPAIPDLDEFARWHGRSTE